MANSTYTIKNISNSATTMNVVCVPVCILATLLGVRFAAESVHGNDYSECRLCNTCLRPRRPPRRLICRRVCSRQRLL